MALGAGFQDIEIRRRLTSDFANIMQRGRYYEQRDRYYEQKQAIDQQERTGERAGARVVRILASGLSTEEMRKELLTVQDEFPSTDLAGTSAGRGMFGAYGMLGRRAGGAMTVPGAMTPAEDMEAKYRKAKTAAVNADDPESVAFWDRKLTQVGSVEDRRVMAEDRRDPLDVSLEAAKRIQRPKSVVGATEAELLGGMTDRIAVDQRIQTPETVVPPPSTARTGDYDYAAAKAAGAKPDAQGHWPSEFKTDAHPDLFVDGLNTKTADLTQVIEVYTQMAVKQLGPSATREKVIALAKKLAKDKGWKIDE